MTELSGCIESQRAALFQQSVKNMTLFKHIGATATLLLALFYACASAAASSIEIRNLSNREILNIRVEPDKKAAPFFLRLDLLPGAADKFVNPETAGTLRIDTGLDLLYFPEIDLRTVNRLSFCGEHGDCIVVEDANGSLRHLAGESKPLLPQPGDRPVCQLDQFRPRMPMQEVCALLDPATPTDDNGAWLAGLGFAKLLWAARLVPAENAKDPASSTLEHLELRRPLKAEECKHILAYLFSRGYTPWQAEFPGMDIDFADLPGKNQEARQKLLEEAMTRFLAAHPASHRAPQVNNVTDEESEARIMLAPESSLDQLANADEPTVDVQLITIILKPLSNTLLLDVTAYMGHQS